MGFDWDTDKLDTLQKNTHFTVTSEEDPLPLSRGVISERLEITMSLVPVRQDSGK